MQPEPLEIDVTLSCDVHPASAPLSAREGAFGENNVPYQAVFGDVSKIIDAARDSAARSVNAAMTAAYWLIGRRIVEFEQSGEERAEYGAALIESLSYDLIGRLDGASLVRTSRTCASSTSHTHPTGFARHCLANWLHPLDGGFARRRLANPRRLPSKLASTTFWRHSRCPGPPTCGCCRSGTRAPAHSTRPRRCEEGGRSASSSGRSAPSSTSAPRSRRTGPPC